MCQKPRILIDWDDTLADLCPVWIDELNKKFALEASIEELNGWDMGMLFPSLTREQIVSPLTEEDFWKKVVAKPDAMEVLPLLLDGGYDIYICTATDYRNLKRKVDDAVLKYFPYIDHTQIICCHHKQMICGDLLIDDNINNLVGGTYQGLLFTAQHNKNIDINSYEDITRVDNWYECYDWIQQNLPAGSAKQKINEGD